MKQQQGFTLIELVVVIVILGILAVTAAPRFLNLQGDARLSTLQGLKGAIDGANALIYSKAAIDGNEQAAAQNVPVQGVNVVADFGYIAAVTDADATATNFINALSIEAADWNFTNFTAATGSTGAIIEIRPASVGATSDCVITYTGAGAANGRYTMVLGDGTNDIDADDCSS